MNDALFSTILNFINIFSAAIGCVLSIIAIWLSLYFYDKSKNTEKEVSDNLIEIKTQTKSLEALSGKMLDKFADYFTKPRPMNEIEQQLLAKLPELNSSKLSNTQESTDPGDRIIQLKIITLYYSGLTNTSLNALIIINPQKEINNSLAYKIRQSYMEFISLRTIWQRFLQLILKEVDFKRFTNQYWKI